MTEPLDGRQREPGGRHLEREALADEAVDLVLVVERVGAGDDTAGAVAEQVDRQPGVALLGDVDHPGDVGDIL